MSALSLVPPVLLVRLAAATLAFTVLAGALVLGRRRLRAWLGAEAVYALWLAVPIGVALCGWPVHRVQAAVAPAAFIAAPLATWTAAPAPTHGAAHAAQWMLAVWLAGAVASASAFALRQRALQRMLGPLRPLDGHADAWLSPRAGVGPMLVGLARPRIVLPPDHAARYTPEELAAILAHERTHLRRGDLWWNALATLLRCLFWFHPLAGLARRRCLADQELACDSAVLRGGVHAPRSYAGALLKTQLAPPGAIGPLACGMLSGSPIYERILNLQRRPAPRRVRLATALVLFGLAAAGARLAWSASIEVVPESADPFHAAAMLKVTTDVAVDDGPARHDQRIIAGALRLDGLRDADGRACSADITPHLLPAQTVDLRMQLVCDGRPAGSPRLLTRLGQVATASVGVTERRPDGRFVTSRGFRLTVRVDLP